MALHIAYDFHAELYSYILGAQNVTARRHGQQDWVDMKKLTRQKR